MRCNALVKPSALDGLVGVYFNLIIPSLVESQTLDCHLRKYRFLVEILSELAIVKAAILLIFVIIGVLATLTSSSYRDPSHCTAIASLAIATYSASHVLWAVFVCFLEYQVTGDPPIKRMMPEVSFGDEVFLQLLPE